MNTVTLAEGDIIPLVALKGTINALLELKSPWTAVKLRRRSTFIRSSAGAQTETYAEAASDSNLLSVSGYFRTSQIKAAACSFGLLRPCSHLSSVLGFTPILNANT